MLYANYSLGEKGMICIECGSPVKSLYTLYSEDNIHATRCTHCNKFADSYIECDNLLVIIDLILLRPGAIRHVVFNSNKCEDLVRNRGTSPLAVMDDKSANKSRMYGGVSSTGIRLFILVTLFDVYLQWGTVEKSQDPHVQEFLFVRHPIVQYILFMLLSISQTFALHFVIRKAGRFLVGYKDGPSISTALLICSFFRLLPILTFIWHYDIPYVSQVVKYVAIVSMVEVLSIVMDCNYIYSSLLTAIGTIIIFGIEKLFWYVI